MINSWLFFRDLSRLQINCIMCEGATERVLHGTNLSVGKLSTRTQSNRDTPAIQSLSPRLKTESLNPEVSKQLYAESVNPSTQHSWISRAWRTLYFLHFRMCSARCHVNLTHHWSYWIKDSSSKSVQIQIFPSTTYPEWVPQRANLGLVWHLR